MDKITIGYKFPPGSITDIEAVKSEFGQFITASKLSKNDIKNDVQEACGDNLVYINPSFVWNAKNESGEFSVIVNTSNNELAGLQDKIQTVFGNIPKYRGGTAFTSVENDIAMADVSLIDFNASNAFNTLLPTQDLFSYFNQLQFSIDDNHEVYLKNNTTVEKFYNDGRISVISDLDDGKWYHYEITFHLVNSNIIRLMEPRFNLAIEDNLFYAEFKNTSGEVGIPFVVDCYDNNTSINKDYFKAFIDQIAVVLKAAQQNNLCPTGPIKLEDRLKDSMGYYFKYIDFTSGLNVTEFVDNQIEYLNDCLLKLTDITDTASVTTYAREQWLQ